MERTQTKLTKETLEQYGWELADGNHNIAGRPTYYHPLYRIRLVLTKEGDRYTAFDIKQSRFTGHTFNTIERLLYHLNAADKTLVRPDRLEDAGWIKNFHGGYNHPDHGKLFLQEGSPSQGYKDVWGFHASADNKLFKTMEELQLLLLEV